MRKSLLLALISAFTTLLSAGLAHAQNSCAKSHTEVFIPAGKFYEFGKLKEWPEIQRRYSESVRYLSKIQAWEQKAIYDAAFFLDHRHMAKILNESLQSGKKLNTSYLIRTYGDRKFFYTNKFEGPFANFVKTNEWLAAEKPAMTVATLKEINRRMLEGRVLLRLTDQQKGHFRRIAVSGNLRHSGVPITAENKINYSENIYLDYAGHDITFATILYEKPLQLERIRHRDSALATQIEAFQKAGKNEKDPDYAALEERAIEALVSERFAWFNAERAKLGAINPKNTETYVDLVAQFQRDLVSIHPFWDGNGRTTRVLMNYLLTKENLPPARIIDPDADLNESLAEWQSTVKKGIKHALELTEEFSIRNDLGLPAAKSRKLIEP